MKHMSWMNTLLSAALSDVNFGHIIRFGYRSPLTPLPVKALPHMLPHPLAWPGTKGDIFTPGNFAVQRLSALVDLGHMLK